MKFSNIEILLEEHPHLLKYAKQRSIEQLGPDVFKRHFNKLNEFDLRDVAKTAGISSKFLKDK